MDVNPVVDRITIYPVKSLDGISLQKAQIGNGGCLVHDREYAILDSNGKFVNGKSNERCIYSDQQLILNVK
ncbi:MAG: MOSC N-terminal beta barrel domain-containing protein [Chitinophagaceae bacterium]|nr:MOSC N-terminal beta barrel domain-containing protein [Chitinophagaceae bacterium]